jgi:hexosaminidase
MSLHSTLIFCAAMVMLTAVQGVRAAPAIVPVPLNMVVNPGDFTLSPDTCVVADAASAVTAQQLGDYLKPATGFALPVVSKKPAGVTTFISLNQSAALSVLGSEGYRLVVTPDSVRITAPTQAGLFYGVQTLRQLLPPQVFSSVPVKNVAWTSPCVQIEDKPRFAWRGLMLDSGHDFQRKAFVERFIDLMAMHKFNTFHWHLTDLGTWSIEIKGHPELLKPETRGPGVKPGYYTQDEIREVVQYAAARHITIVPEIDMPGHSTPALIAHPELDCPLPEVDGKGNPMRPWQYCLGNEKTYQFLEDVLSQIVELFPGPYVHIGGDECPKDRWNRCPLCQAKMKAENLKNADELQSYFVRRIETFLHSKGRRLIGWDEILEGGLAPDATVMSWRGMEGGVAAARAGHDVVMAPNQWTYFDHAQMPLETVYNFDPIPKELTPAEATHILGTQGQMWTDNHPSENEIDALVYPRAAALAEVAWSPVDKRDYTDFIQRLHTHLQRLAELGVHYRPLPRPFNGTAVGNWGPAQTFKTPTIVEWPLTTGINGNGRYEIMFKYDHGASRYEIHSVEIVQGGKVIASDKHFGMTGAADVDNVYTVDLPALTNQPLILRALVGTDWMPDSYGQILIEKVN